MDDLIEWLRGVLNDDECAAQAATSGHCRVAESSGEIHGDRVDRGRRAPVKDTVGSDVDGHEKPSGREGMNQGEWRAAASTSPRRFVVSFALP